MDVAPQLHLSGEGHGPVSFVTSTLLLSQDIAVLRRCSLLKCLPLRRGLVVWAFPLAHRFS